MTLKSRLRKLEARMEDNNKGFAPTIITLYQDDNQEEALKCLKAKYGEDYEPRMILIYPTTREEARRERGNTIFYKEIEDI